MMTHSARNKGFAMLEVLIAIIAVTTLLTTIMIPGLTLNNYEKRKTTHQRIQTVQRALNQYVQTFGRLPCPVAPNNPTTTNYTEIVAVNNCDNSVPTFNNNTPNVLDKVYYGAVPVQNLGLSQEYAQDGWGNKIMYVVPNGFTYKPDATSPAQLPITFYKSTNGSYAIPATTIDSGVLYYTNGAVFTNYLTTAYMVNSSASTRNTQNLYVLLSYGENGYGAYSITGTQNSASSANAATGEDQNIFIAAKANTVIYTNPSRSMKGGSLDDIVYETGIVDIINTGSSIQDSIGCDYLYIPFINAVQQLSPPAAATLDIGNNRYSTTPYYVPNAEVLIQDNCPTGCANGSTAFRKYIKCLTGGNWGGVYQKSCAC